MFKTKAIQTVYNNYKFRSRLEARWAVFFDKLGINYEYESEGYELSDGTRYLPDFYLPEEHVFIEIKGEYPTEEYKKMLGVFAESTGDALLLISGSPGKQVMELYCYDSTESTGGNGWNDIKGLSLVRGLLLFHVDDAHKRVYSTNDCEHWFDMTSSEVSESFLRSLAKARQARFEFGETPS